MLNNLKDYRLNVLVVEVTKDFGLILSSKSKIVIFCSWWNSETRAPTVVELRIVFLSLKYTIVIN